MLTRARDHSVRSKGSTGSGPNAGLSSAASPVPSSPEPSPSSNPDSPLSPDTLPPPVNDVFNSQIPQQGEINENTGGFTQTYPIAVPPGRNSLQPDLKLI